MTKDAAIKELEKFRYLDFENSVGHDEDSRQLLLRAIGLLIKAVLPVKGPNET